MAWRRVSHRGALVGSDGERRRREGWGGGGAVGSKGGWRWVEGVATGGGGEEVGRGVLGLRKGVKALNRGLNALNNAVRLEKVTRASARRLASRRG